MNVSPQPISRISLMMTSGSALSNMTRTNLSLFDVTNQLSSNRRVNRASDDSVAAAAISVLNNRIAQSAQREVSLRHAGNVLGALDTSLSQATDIARDAQSLASSQIGLTSDTTTRRQQASVVDSMLRKLYDLVNQTHDGSPQGVYLYGGSTAGTRPLQEVSGGYRYVGRGSGVVTDLGLSDGVPITIGGNNALGETSSRVRSAKDLNPALNLNSQLTDLGGARGLGIGLGVVNFTFSGSAAVGSVDLTGAASMNDVVVRVRSAIESYETANGVTILGPSGVTVAGNGISIDVVAAGAATLTFTDPSNGRTAADLGLTASPFTNATPVGSDLNQRLTWQTPVNSLSGVSTPLGSIRARFVNAGVSSITDIDLSGAQTLDDVRSIVQTTAPGLRVEINQAGTGINIVSEIAGPELHIEEVPGGANTATELGIRSFDTTTSIADFNDGRGVRIVDGVNDPVTGVPTAALNSDFRVTLGNGQYFDVDLRPQDLTDVQTVTARIQAEFAAAIGTQNNTAAPALAAGQFNIGLTTGINGFSMSSSVAGAISIKGLNNSAAAEDLGLTNLTLDGASSTYVAQDRAGVRVQNIFSDLIALRDSLLRDDSAGITQAAASLNTNADRLSAAHALVGTYAQRVDIADSDRSLRLTADQKTKSELQDVDFAEAATRYSQLQTSLEATLRIAGQAGSKSLFDFLG